MFQVNTVELTMCLALGRLVACDKQCLHCVAIQEFNGYLIKEWGLA